jgi:phosphoribosylformylglycinamidine synthase
VPFFFGEDQARYVLAVPAKEADKIEGELRAAGIIHAIIGKTIAAKVVRVEREGELSIAALKKTHEGWFPSYMAAPHAN